MKLLLPKEVRFICASCLLPLWVEHKKCPRCMGPLVSRRKVEAVLSKLTSNRRV